MDAAGLRTMPVGDPWLSTGLVRVGEAIYLAKWEEDWRSPRLLHIQSMGDVALFGISGANYARYVLDGDAWETHFGMSTTVLARGELGPAAEDVAVAGVAAPGRPALMVQALEVNGGRGGSDGRGWVVGEVRNTGAGEVCGYSITVSLADGHGIIAGTYRAEVQWRLPAGAAQPFSIPVRPLPPGARADVRVVAGDAACLYAPLATDSAYLEEVRRERSDGSLISQKFRVRGNVRNDMDHAVQDVRVLVAFVAADGRLVDVQGSSGSVHARATELTTGGATGFEVDSS
jgi:hypothetical protein